MFDPESIYKLAFVSDPQISSDGELVAFVVARAEESFGSLEDSAANQKKPPKGKGYHSNIYLSRAGEMAVPFTMGARDFKPRFSPDGSWLAFLSTRLAEQEQGAKKPQIFVMSTNGGEARALTKLKSGVDQLRWSPDGTRIAFLAKGDVEDLREERGEPRVFERVGYKRDGIPGRGFLSDQPTQLWIINLDGGEPLCLTTHATDITSFDWLPNGSGLVFTAARDALQEVDLAAELFYVGLFRGEVGRITDWNGLISAPVVSPDGSQVAFVGGSELRKRPGDPHVYTCALTPLALAGEEFSQPVRWCNEDLRVTTILAADSHFGEYPEELVWLSNDELLASAMFGGSGGIVRLSRDGMKVVYHDKEVSVAAFSATRSGSIALLKETKFVPCDAYRLRFGALERLSTIGEDSVAEFARSERCETFELKRGDFTVEGWLLYPTNWREGERYPAILSVHGGPAAAYGQAYCHEFQLYAARGYAVLYCNIRGSSGYGDAQTRGNNGVFGGEDYEDLMAFLEAVLERHSWIDANRLGICGGSYGGFMTSWAIGHTDRFKAAVVDRMVSNWVSFYATSDVGYRFVPREFSARVPEDFERLWEMSPMRYASNVRTPCLVIHGEDDHRTPVEQGEQWFVALAEHGVPTRFVRFPGECHEIARSGRPDRRVVRLREYLDWFAKYL